MIVLLVVLARTSFSAPSQVNPEFNDKWNYGPLTNGLRAAVELEDGQQAMGGRTVALRFHLRNETNHSIQIYTFIPRYTTDGEIKLADENGKPVRVKSPECTYIAPTRRMIIKSGEEAVVESVGLTFLVAPGDAERANDPCGYSAHVTPGTYTLQIALWFRDLGSKWSEPLDWHGTLTTGPVKIKVKARAASESQSK